MTAIIRCLRNHTIFKTGADDIARDYVHPEDLMQLLYCCSGETRNYALDVYSKMPAKKSEIIAFFKETYGLNVEVRKTNVQESLTGIKPCYFSQNHAAEHIGYVPQFSSMDCIQKESAALLDETT
jgi:nucleoside-diphosphate-sugar epimerase